MAATMAAIGAGALAVGTVGMVASVPAHQPATVGVAADPEPEPALDRRVPEGHRLVGHGRLALAVPEEWATDATECGTPTQDTVVDPQGLICLALVGRPADVTSVELGRGSDPLVEGLDGPATAPTLRRERTECRVDYSTRPPADPSTGKRRSVLCSATVADGGGGSAITVTSSIDDPATAQATVDELADAVFLLDDDEVVVPSLFDGDWMSVDDTATYRDRLEAAGLEVEVVEVRRLPAIGGRFIAVDPAVSTVLPRGATVRLEVVAPPETFVDGVQLGGNHTGHLGGGNEALSDERIRAGATISLAVGESFWVFAEPVVWSQEQEDQGGGASTPVGGRISFGQSLERVNEDRVEVAQWAAVRPGTSTVVMTVTDDEGVEHHAGTVTVEVTD